MIPRSLQKRLSRVEALIEDAVKKRAWRAGIPLRQARCHAASVAALVLYGGVDIGEPLELAWRRAIEKLWVLVGERVERELREQGGEEFLKKTWSLDPEDPDVRFGPVHVIYPLFMLDSLPGKDDGSKLGHVFSSAPVWLLKFTDVERDAGLLGFELPDLSAAPALGREARTQRDQWPYLPDGTIYDGGPCDDPDTYLSTEELLTQHQFLY